MTPSLRDRTAGRPDLQALYRPIAIAAVAAALRTAAAAPTAATG